MNLTDQEILELSELCNALVDGTIDEKQKERLGRWLAESGDARRFYVRTMGLSASLFTYASEMQSEAPDAPRALIIHLNFYRWAGVLAAAASIALLIWVFGGMGRAGANNRNKPGEFVARLTGSSKCVWRNSNAPARGDSLPQGQHLDLTSGYAEITFDSGAQVVLVGPVSLDVNSAWDATLREGSIKATVPPEAVGFRISNPAVEVVDLGTEFTMTADTNGTAEVLVLKGKVEAERGMDTDEQTVVLHAKEARRFDSSGVSAVTNSEKEFAQWTTRIPMDRTVEATRFVHWSFDESAGTVFKADTFGVSIGNHDAQLDGEPAGDLAGLRMEGRWRGALQFDGEAFAKAPFRGISGSQAHTVAFWVNVPEDAQLSESYAMVAWGMDNRKPVAAHPVHICWNRNPAEGTVGALRTDYGGGFALGKTSLRDGRWHHVAVVFVPGSDERMAAEVKQYVDGRFEGEGHPSPPGRRSGPANSRAEAAGPVNDTIWLGCRLGNDGQKRDRFRGGLDELWIADRALEPREIVDLMRNNQPPQPLLALLRK